MSEKHLQATQACGNSGPVHEDRLELREPEQLEEQLSRSDKSGEEGNNAA